MDQHPGDPAAMHGRTRGLQQVRRWSNWTAARTNHPAVPAAAALAAGTVGAQPGTAAGPQQPCVSVPVATSGGSGVTRQTVVRSCGTGSSAPVVVTTGRTYEGGDS